MRLPKCYAVISLLAILLLPGCGGGGDDGGDPGDNGAASDDEDNDGNNDTGRTTYSLEGTIRAAAGSAVDGDLNDPLAPLQANNERGAAQPVPNPVTLGGYANQAGAGPRGTSQVSGDPLDWYRVSLAAGQTITLFIAADGLQNDLDLGLFDSNGTLIDAGVGKTRVESLTAGQSGDYFVLVEAFRGASNYILTIGQQRPPAAAGFRLSDPFVPGEIITLFSPLPTTLKGSSVQARAQSLGLTVKGGAEDRNMLLSLSSEGRPLASQTLGSAPDESYQGLKASDPDQQLKFDTLRTVKALSLDAGVIYAAPNYLRSRAFVPNDLLYPFQWHYPLLNLPQAWDLNSGGGAIVAVVDTGVLLAHPDLQGQLIEGYDFTSNPANAGDGDGIDPDPNDPGDVALPGGSSFHGTHLAGTIAAASNNAAGVAGVAFSARIMPLRVAGRFGASDYDIEQAVRYAAQLPNDSGTLPSRRADVINLSLGGPGASPASEAVFNQVRAAGTVIVAAAGNDGNSAAVYPASYPAVISVSAVDINKTPAPYSSFGPFIDLAAPGGDNATDINGDGKSDGVLSTAASDASGTVSAGYAFYSGTSMAAAHVSGVIALMRAANPALTPQDIDNLLASGALTEDLGPAGRDDRFGHGLINAYQAVVAAANTPGGQPVTPVAVLVATPSALNFGLDLSSLTLTVSNGGGGSLKVNPPSEDSGGWLRLGAAVDENGLGSYTLTVDRSNLPDGLYTATLTFTSNANTVQIPVIMQVARDLRPGEAGPQYVLLIDPASLDTVAQMVAVSQNDGRYFYRFENVPAGRYEIFSGSDFNNDGFICDPGESCGAYLTLDEPVNIDLRESLSGLDFVSSFVTELAEVKSSAAVPRTGLKRPGIGKVLRPRQ